MPYGDPALFTDPSRDRLPVDRERGVDRDHVISILAVQIADGIGGATDVLENAPYNDEQCNTTWEDCSLRTFLNGPFCDSAFTEAERLLIPKTKMKNKGNSASMTKGGNDTEDYHDK